MCLELLWLLYVQTSYKFNQLWCNWFLSAPFGNIHIFSGFQDILPRFETFLYFFALRLLFFPNWNRGNWGHLRRSEKVKVLAAQSCLILCDPMGCKLLGSSVHGILQAIILEWVTIRFPRESSRPWDQTQVSCIAGRFFTIWATREAHS